MCAGALSRTRGWRPPERVTELPCAQSPQAPCSGARCCARLYLLPNRGHGSMYSSLTQFIQVHVPYHNRRPVPCQDAADSTHRAPFYASAPGPAKGRPRSDELICRLRRMLGSRLCYDRWHPWHIARTGNSTLRFFSFAACYEYVSYSRLEGTRPTHGSSTTFCVLGPYRW